jgi:arsenite methyltransferase
MSGDIWSAWLLKRRFGGNSEETKRVHRLVPIRDRVLANAALNDGETLLDVGCGDGLIAFGALALQPNVKVIFADISAPLLAHSRQLATEANVLDRCEFIETPANNLSAIRDSSVDVVTTRSVLIYVDDKQTAFREFYRVLKPGGRLSIFEPINIFGYEQPETEFWGLDATPVVEAANKLKAQARALQPPETDAMLNFDERDLFRLAEVAGFGEIHLDYSARLARWGPMDWSSVLHAAPNPKLPTWDEAMNEMLTPAEKELFIAHIRPQVEAGTAKDKSAEAFLWAIK